ncbi:MAG: hypothetical protein JJ964_10365 [Rhizobiales bacterium]|nr:hypothetical protein [Hyphomicrobiales bacterium]
MAVKLILYLLRFRCPQASAHFSLTGYSAAEAAGPPRGGAHAGLRSSYAMSWRYKAPLLLLVDCSLFSLTAVPSAYLYFNAHKTSAKKQPF